VKGVLINKKERPPSKNNVLQKIDHRSTPFPAKSLQILEGYRR
jgi:hypothetical protein